MLKVHCCEIAFGGIALITHGQSKQIKSRQILGKASILKVSSGTIPVDPCQERSVISRSTKQNLTSGETGSSAVQGQGVEPGVFREKSLSRTESL